MGDQGWLTRKWFTSPIYIKTLLMFAAYGCVGWSDSLFGVNLTQLQVHFGSSTGDTSYLVQAASLGFTLGNAMLSVACTRIDLHNVFLSCITLLSVSNLILPHIPTLLSMSLFFFLSGFAGGSLEAVCISRILLIWGKDSVTLLQLLDFGYGVGSIAGPFVTAPFLPDTRIINTEDSTPRGELLPYNSSSTSPLSASSVPEIDLISPYSIAGGIFSFVAVCSLWMWLRHRKDSPISDSIEVTPVSPTGVYPNEDQPLPVSLDSSSSSPAATSLSPRLKGLLICLVATTYAFSNGMGMIEQSFLTVYITKDPFQLNPARGARLEGATWMIHTISGVLFLPVIHRIGIAKNLLIGCCIICFGNIVLVIMSPSGQEWVMWFGLFMTSIGGTTFFGSLIALMEGNFVVSPRVTSLFLIPNCISNIIWPFIVGHLMDINPQYFIYCLTLCGFVASFLVIITLTLIRVSFPRNQKEL